MNYLDILKSTNGKTQKTVACIESYAEYIDSKIRDIGNFVTDNSENESYMSVVISNVVGAADRVVTVAKSEFQKAMNGDETVSIIKPDGTTSSIESELLIDSVNYQLTGAQIESQFLQYCKNTKDNISSSDFVTRIQSLVNNVAPTILESYTKILDTAGDKIDAITAFFQLHDTSEVTYNVSNNYITIVDGSKYEGSVWSAAATQIVSQISDFFNVVWQGIKHIKEFVASIVDGLAKLGKWFITKMFHNLSTVYEKLGDDPAQVMDLPIMQLDLGKISGDSFYNQSISDLVTWMSNYEYPDGTEYSLFNLSTNAKISRGSSGYQVTYRMLDALRTKFINISIPDDGVLYGNSSDVWCYQVTDMIIPSNPFNLLLRIGVNESDHHAYLCMYVCFSKGTLDLSDDDISLMVEQSLQDAIVNVFMPTTFFARKHPVNSSGTGPSYYANYLRSFIMASAGDDPCPPLYELVANKMFSIKLSDIPTYTSEESTSASLKLSRSDVVMMLLQYVAYTGCGNYRYNFDWTGMEPGYVKVSKIPAIDYSSSAIMSNYLIVDSTQTSYDYDLVIDSFGSLSSMSDEFIPYNVSNPIPFSIHYQTTDEQATEIVHLFWAVVAVIAITVVAVKVVKWRKTRVNTGQLLLANRDRLSWEYCANPTNENRAAFLTAQRKYRRYDKLNKILGLSSSADDIYNLVVPATDNTQQQIISILKGTLS